MARPKHTNPENFTSGEISHGTGISVRNLQVLRDSGLSPNAAEISQNTPSNLYDLGGLVHFSLVGALVSSGLALVHSAKLAKALRWEFNDFRFGYMSGLSRNRFGNDVGYWTPETGDYNFEFWYHRGLRLNNIATYCEKTAWDNDILLLVADQQYALIDIHKRIHSGIKTIFGNHTVETGPDPFCQIVDSDDGSGPTVIPLYEREEWNNSARQLDLLQEYRDALNNAVGVTRVNLSLAIRNSADRIHDLRAEKGGRLFEI